MSKRPYVPAPPDPGIIPGGIRDRALKAVVARGPRYEDPAKTAASQEYWRAQQAQAGEIWCEESGELRDIAAIVGDVFSTELPF